MLLYVRSPLIAFVLNPMSDYSDTAMSAFDDCDSIAPTQSQEVCPVRRGIYKIVNLKSGNTLDLSGYDEKTIIGKSVYRPRTTNLKTPGSLRDK